MNFNKGLWLFDEILINSWFRIIANNSSYFRLYHCNEWKIASEKLWNIWLFWTITVFYIVILFCRVMLEIYIESAACFILNTHKYGSWHFVLHLVTFRTPSLGTPGGWALRRDEQTPDLYFKISSIQNKWVHYRWQVFWFKANIALMVEAIVSSIWLNVREALQKWNGAWAELGNRSSSVYQHVSSEPCHYLSRANLHAC